MIIREKIINLLERPRDGMLTIMETMVTANKSVGSREAMQIFLMTQSIGMLELIMTEPERKSETNRAYATLTHDCEERAKYVDRGHVEFEDEGTFLDSASEHRVVREIAARHDNTKASYPNSHTVRYPIENTNPVPA